MTAARSAVVAAMLCVAVQACSPAVQDSVDKADSLNGQLAHCRDVGRAADAGNNIEAYEACKADAGIQ